MTSVAIRSRALTKTYGRARGISNVDLEVAAGEVFGLLGPNGAGKSTFMRCLIDAIRPTSGSLEVLGLDSRRDAVAVHRQVSYLPGDVVLWPRMTGREIVDLIARLRGGLDQRRVDDLVERLAIDPTRPLADLSKGNRQKVGLLAALAPIVDVYVLDEPTSGLDPLLQARFRDLAREQVERGACVLLSSHVMSEVERVADRVGVVREGELVAVESVEVLRDRASRRVEVRFAAAAPQDALAGVEGLRHIEIHGDTLRCTSDGIVDPLVKALAQYEVIALRIEEADLEDVFMSFYFADPTESIS